MSKVKMPDGRVVSPDQDMEVEYVGSNVGIVKYRGPSLAVYRFSAARTKRVMCSIDAAWFAKRADFVVRDLPPQTSG